MSPAARRVARTIAEGRHFHVELEAATLVRVTSHPRGEPYFGRTGRNRFDAPGPKPASQAGLLMAGSARYKRGTPGLAAPH